MRTLLVVIMALAVVACAPTKEFTTGSYQPADFAEKDVLNRPIINKTPYEEPEPEEEEPTGIRVEQLSTPVEEYKLSVGYGLVGVGNVIGGPDAQFTKYEFPELLKSRNVRGGAHPVAGMYEQFLRLTGGRVRFTANEEDVVSDYLVYRDEETVYEYEFIFSDGSFLDYIGNEIWFLGHKYVIEDATKKDVILYDTELGNELVIGDGTVRFNREVLANTDSRMTGNAILLKAMADAVILGDDIFIPPGSSLQEHLGEPTLLTDRIDIRYKGILEVPHSRYEFENKGDEIELVVTQPNRGTFYIPLAFKTENGWRLGDEEGVLNLGSSVKIDEHFILTSSVYSQGHLYNLYQQGSGDRISAVFQYKDITPSEQKIEIVSREGFALEAYYGASSRSGIIRFAGRDFSFAVGSETEGYPLTIDSSNVFVTEDGTIDFPGESFSGPATVNFKLFNFGEGTQEALGIRINPDDEFTMTFQSSLETFQMGRNDEIAASNFGTKYFLFNEEDDKTYEEIVIDHPLAKRLAEVVVESR